MLKRQIRGNFGMELPTSTVCVFSILSCIALQGRYIYSVGADAQISVLVSCSTNFLLSGVPECSDVVYFMFYPTRFNRMHTLVCLKGKLPVKAIGLQKAS